MNNDKKIGFKDLKWYLKIPIITSWTLTILYIILILVIVLGGFYK